MGTIEQSFSSGKKRWRSIVWRMKAAVKRAVKNNGGGSCSKGNKRLRFQYDPSSYALNFDDGCCDVGEKITRFVFYQNESKIIKNSFSKSGGHCIYYSIVFVES